VSLLVCGTLAFDSIETPFESRTDMVGGSATYFAHAARYFGPVGVVGVVGTDFPDAVIGDFSSRDIDSRGIEVAEGKTFRWAGRYGADWNTRTTLDTQLNVFAEFDPKIPVDYRSSDYLFLANAEPALQRKALDQVEAPKFVLADTMNLWIETARADLEVLLSEVDGLVINDEEAFLLTGKRNLFVAAEEILRMGPRILILKKGEHGAFLLGDGVRFALPAYPVAEVVDPTGAGDSFAGGFMGYVASVANVEPSTLRRAMLYGTVTASFCVEGFSVETLAHRSRAQIESRFDELHSLLSV